MILLTGKFTKYIYQNIENNFFVAIFKLNIEQDGENQLQNIASNITVSMKNIEVPINKPCKIEVNESKSSKYKDSFELISFDEIIIDPKAAAIEYLSSKKFPTITKPLAQKIINELGFDFLKNTNNYCDKLKMIVSEKKALLIIEQINSEKIYHEILTKFSENNLSMRLLYIIEKKYQNQELLNFLETDIYSVLEWSDASHFFDVDNIAKIFLKNFSDDIRTERFIYWSLTNLCFSEGSTIFDIKELYLSISKNFGIVKEDFMKSIKRLIEKGFVILSENKQSITPSTIYEKELYIVERLTEINSKQPNQYKNNIDYDDIDEIQNSALKHALNNSITVISGYPGTGKTTLVDKLVKNLELTEPNTFNLLAPTGKAAYQIFLKTNHTARTIHSFLGMKKGSNFFRINEQNPSNVKTLIIDEFSMINIELFYSLLIGCPYLERLILIGDKNQLPSIGAGYLLNDIIESGKFKTFLLEKIYRQETGSSIIDIALVINNQQTPIFNSKEAIFIEENEKNAAKKILEKIDYFISNNILLGDYQILVPMYAGECGIDNLNVLIQNKYSKNKEYIEIRNNKFYIGDKVIQIENDNEANVFNGEIGYIKEFKKSAKKHEITVEFEDGKIIKYTSTNFVKNIKLAYAISIHKFQGSESKNIILVMYYSHYILLSKKLLYTAVTRAVENLIIFGEQRAIDACVKKDNDSKRVGNILQLLFK